MLLETELICITLLENRAGDAELRLALDTQLNTIAEQGKKLIGYALLSDYTNQANSRFVKFLATFSKLNPKE